MLYNQAKSLKQHLSTIYLNNLSIKLNFIDCIMIRFYYSIRIFLGTNHNTLPSLWGSKNLRQIFNLKQGLDLKLYFLTL